MRQPPHPRARAPVQGAPGQTFVMGADGYLYPVPTAARPPRPRQHAPQQRQRRSADTFNPRNAVPASIARRRQQQERQVQQQLQQPGVHAMQHRQRQAAGAAVVHGKQTSPSSAARTVRLRSVWLNDDDDDDGDGGKDGDAAADQQRKQGPHGGQGVAHSSETPAGGAKKGKGVVVAGHTADESTTDGSTRRQKPLAVAAAAIRKRFALPPKGQRQQQTAEQQSHGNADGSDGMDDEEWKRAVQPPGERPMNDYQVLAAQQQQQQHQQQQQLLQHSMEEEGSLPDVDFTKGVRVVSLTKRDDGFGFIIKGDALRCVHMCKLRDLWVALRGFGLGFALLVFEGCLVLTGFMCSIFPSSF